MKPLGQFDLQTLAQDNNLELSGLLQWYQRIHQQVNPLLGAFPIWKRPESFICFPPEIHHRITEWLALEGRVKIIIMSKVRVEHRVPPHPCCFQNVQARGKSHLWRLRLEGVTAPLGLSRSCFGSLGSAPAGSAEMSLYSGPWD